MTIKKAKKKAIEKGILSLETGWYEDLGGEPSIIESTLRLAGFPYRHSIVWTKEVFELHLKEWKKPEYRKHFPVLLLAFYRETYGYDDEWMFPMDELVEHLSEDAPNKAIIHISSSFHVRDDEMEDFLKKTGALSVSVSDYDDSGHNSAAFELLFLAELFRYDYWSSPRPPSTPKLMQKFVDRRYAKNKGLEALGKALGFRLWYRVDEDNLKTDKHPSYITPVPRLKELEG